MANIIITSLVTAAILGGAFYIIKRGELSKNNISYLRNNWIKILNDRMATKKRKDTYI